MLLNCVPVFSRMFSKTFSFKLSNIKNYIVVNVSVVESDLVEKISIPLCSWNYSSWFIYNNPLPNRSIPRMFYSERHIPTISKFELHFYLFNVCGLRNKSRRNLTTNCWINMLWTTWSETARVVYRYFFYLICLGIFIFISNSKCLPEIS